MEIHLLNYLKEKANAYDIKDPLQQFRSRFSIPTDEYGNEKIYLCNNSLGLPSKNAFTLMQHQMNKWSQQGVEGWFTGDDNWYSSLDELIRAPLAGILGADRSEVIAMNTLTVNLHLLLVSFYRPNEKRFKILIEGPTFPSDLYAIKSHLKLHGLNPDDALHIIEPKNGAEYVTTEDVIQTINHDGDSIALVFLSSVNFLTGYLLDIETIAQIAHEKGCFIGLDLAHAAGNTPMCLHKWNVDFAVGCSYKYLCSGPGGPGIAYIHSSHHKSELPRLCGWWGNDPKTRFQMQLIENFIPFDGAYSWQVSTPSILSLTPLIASLDIYKDARMDRIREKSVVQTEYLIEIIETIGDERIEIITPRDVDKRGCQISLRIKNGAERIVEGLSQAGVICDFRAPDILRVTPSALYNSLIDIYTFGMILRRVLKTYNR